MLVLGCMHLIKLFCDLPSCCGTDSLHCQGLVFLARYSVCNVDSACAMLVLPIQQLLDSKCLHNNNMCCAADDNLVFAALCQRMLAGNAHDALLHVSNAAVLK